MGDRRPSVLWLQGHFRHSIIPGLTDIPYPKEVGLTFHISLNGDLPHNVEDFCKAAPSEITPLVNVS